MTCVCVKTLYQRDMCLCEDSVTCVCVKVLYQRDVCLCEGIVLA